MMGVVSLASVLPGSGLVLRRGPISAVVDGLPADRAATLLAELVDAEPGSLADLIDRRLTNTGESPALAVAVAADDQLDVVVTGPAAAIINGDAVRSAVGSSRSVRVGAGARVVLVADGSAPAAAGDAAPPVPQLSFDAGMVPGAGLVVWTGTTATAAARHTELAPPHTRARLDDPAEWDTRDTGRKPLARQGTGRVEGQRRRTAAPTLIPPSDDIPVTGDADSDLANARTEISEIDVPAAQPVSQLQIHGLLCPHGHINDPRLQLCARCGIRIDRMTGALVQGPRPPLGLLVIDDGATYVVSSDLLIGRDPEPAADNRGGIAADGVGPLNSIRLVDNSGAMSRAHCEIRLVEWDVRILDAGSVNGTYVWIPGQPGWQRALPGKEVLLVPGAQIRIGNRAMLFESPHGTAQSSSGSHAAAPPQPPAYGASSYGVPGYAPGPVGRPQYGPPPLGYGPPGPGMPGYGPPAGPPPNYGPQGAPDRWPR